MTRKSSYLGFRCLGKQESQIKYLTAFSVWDLGFPYSGVLYTNLLLYIVQNIYMNQICYRMFDLILLLFF